MRKTLFLIFLILSPVSSFGAVKLPAILSDGVILQREKTLILQGDAAAGEEITLIFKQKRYKTKADKNGRWKLELPPQKAGGPWEMIFRGENELKVSDILFGDVWLCSGQSNMVLPMERVKEKYPDEIRNAEYPEIRQFRIPTMTSLNGPEEALPEVSWTKASPEEVLDFSAVAYFFAKAVYEKYEVPIGIINSSVGGTPVEAWMSRQALQEFPDIAQTVERNRDEPYVDSLKETSKPAQQTEMNDVGLLQEPKWYEPDYVPKGWHHINIPGYWEDQGVRDLDGTVWYRREVEVPESMTGRQAKLFMGRIVDADMVYVNGERVGGISYKYPPRRYEIPAGLLKPGKNLFVIRVRNYHGKGGFVPDKPYYLSSGDQEIDLKGTWQYKVGEVYEPSDENTGSGFSEQRQPTVLYNAMIAPLEDQKIKGIIWYQGESNTGNPELYYRLFPAMIKDWRDRWSDPDLPFIYVQLANYMDVDYLPTESRWAELRDAQLHALSVPNTAMAVAIDLGEWNDVHPLNKKEVGERLALGAFRVAYGEDIVYSGPIYDHYEKNGNRIIIYFRNAGSGLVSKDGEELRRFEIAGKDGKFVWANARITGENTVEVWNEEVQDPVKVRYAWADNPRDANLYNEEGLPASPFQAVPQGSTNDQTIKRLND